MSPDRVLSREQLESQLNDLGCAPTGIRTATGEWWKTPSNSNLFFVPDPLDGFYPDWMLEEITKIAGELDPWKH